MSKRNGIVRCVPQCAPEDSCPCSHADCAPTAHRDTLGSGDPATTESVVILDGDYCGEADCPAIDFV